MNYKQKANECRKKVLEMIHHAGTSHIASNFSVIDIATVLYENLKEEDEVVWSKGWSAATIYYFLAKQGKIPEEDLDKFPNSPYLGLAETSVNGVWVSGGSMGHGLPIAVGMALGKKRQRKICEKKYPKGDLLTNSVHAGCICTGTIYCIMSDGEMNEGTTWESAAVAAHHKLGNLVVLIDCNKWQAVGKTKDILDFEPIEKHWEGFGWMVYRVDGHNFENIIFALERATQRAWLLPELKEELIRSPTVIICDTIKGKGVSFFENHLLYHYKHVDDEEYKLALKEL